MVWWWVLALELEVFSHSMVYFCLPLATSLPSQDMEQAGHWVIDSHCSCYCHSNLWGKKGDHKLKVQFIKSLIPTFNLLLFNGCR